MKEGMETTNYGDLTQSSGGFYDARDKYLKSKEQFVDYLLNEASEDKLVAYLKLVNQSIDDLTDFPESYKIHLKEVADSGSVMLRSHTLHGITDKKLPDIIKKALRNRLTKTQTS